MSGNRLKEEIRLMIDNVKYKKMEGALYLMSERIAWMQKQKSVFLVSHNYVDIKTQKISTDGKVKVQLQIVLHDDSSSTFHFVSNGGPTKQLQERDQVKDMLVEILPKFKQQISRELEEKKRILMQNPNIYLLYNELVVGHILSAEDFWKNFVDANICPKSDGLSGLNYDLTYDDKESIFKTYPTVKLKFYQNVPNKMSEIEFWTKFFQSYYFRRDQINSATNDLFADCTLKDDEEMRQNVKKYLSDPLKIINAQKELSAEDGFGLTDFLGNRSGNVSNQNLIKRYNYYSMRVLNAMEESGGVARTDKLPKEAVPKKKMRMDEEIKDLEDEDNELRGAPIHLASTEGYFSAPLTSANRVGSATESLLKNKNVKTFAEESLSSIQNWTMDVSKLANNNLAVGILVELSPGSQLMQTNGVQNMKEEIPKANQEEIKSLYTTSSEMIKKFHEIFPPKNTEQELKLKSIKENLELYYQQKIIALHDRLAKENFAWNLTFNLENMYKIVFSKFNTWQLKQNS